MRKNEQHWLKSHIMFPLCLYFRFQSFDWYFNEYVWVSVQKEKVKSIVHSNVGHKECSSISWWSVRFEFFIFWYFCGLLAYTSEIYYGIKWKWCIHSVFVALWMHEADVSVKTRRNAKRKKRMSQNYIRIWHTNLDWMHVLRTMNTTDDHDDDDQLSTACTNDWFNRMYDVP